VHLSSYATSALANFWLFESHRLQHFKRHKRLPAVKDLTGRCFCPDETIYSTDDGWSCIDRWKCVSCEKAQRLEREQRKCKNHWTAWT